MSGPQILAANGWSVKNSCCQKLSGIHAAAAPAINSPMTMSRSTAAHSMTKLCETLVKPSRETSRRQNDAAALDAHVHRGVAFHRAGHRPVGLLPGRVDQPLAQSSRRNSSARMMIMIGPPTNSAAVNCQPSSKPRMRPSSMTRLVLAN